VASGATPATGTRPRATVVTLTGHRAGGGAGSVTGAGRGRRSHGTPTATAVTRAAPTPIPSQRRLRAVELPGDGVRVSGLMADGWSVRNGRKTHYRRLRRAPCAGGPTAQTAGGRDAQELQFCSRRDGHFTIRSEPILRKPVGQMSPPDATSAGRTTPPHDTQVPEIIVLILSFRQRTRWLALCLRIAYLCHQPYRGSHAERTNQHENDHKT
jgi:hypothetical protein